MGSGLGENGEYTMMNAITALPAYEVVNHGNAHVIAAKPDGSTYDTAAFVHPTGNIAAAQPDGSMYDTMMAACVHATGSLVTGQDDITQDPDQGQPALPAKARFRLLQEARPSKQHVYINEQRGTAFDM